MRDIMHEILVRHIGQKGEIRGSRGFPEGF